MKNIHLIPTDKPSRLFYNKKDSIFTIDNDFENVIEEDWFQDYNIYITSDEEIKEGDWFIANNGVHKCIRVAENTSCPFITLNSKGEEIGHFKTWRTKIILTTDQDLIGVQAINDEFLEWFVKNPSCEEVEVGETYPSNCCINKEGKTKMNNGCMERNMCLNYKIIIPKEELTISDEAKQRAANYMSLKGALEPKQETLEEAAKNYAEEYKGEEQDPWFDFMEGAKWQQKQDKKLYSEEDMLNFAWFLKENLGQYSCDRTAHFEGKYLEQFKKK